MAVVVSEETGSISICHRRRIERKSTPETFRQRIAEILLHSKYEETDSEQLAREADLSAARDHAWYLIEKNVATTPSWYEPPTQTPVTATH